VSVREKEEKTDHYEDILGTYLVKLSARQISSADSEEAAKLLKMIGDFERIADHAVNLLETAEEMERKALTFSETAVTELKVITSAVEEVLDLSLAAFLNQDKDDASMVEPLEEVIDLLKEQLRTRHILRLQQGECTIDAGFVWSDLLTNLERTSDHCSNIAGCVMEMDQHDMNLHESLRDFKNGNEEFRERYQKYVRKYALVKEL
jgi:phosphate:Na+ symporter